MYRHQAPVLSVCWNEASLLVNRSAVISNFCQLMHVGTETNFFLQEGNRVFSGSVDNTGLMFDAATGQSIPFAQHDGPVKAVKWLNTPYTGVVVTGSWDKTVKAGLPSDAPLCNVEICFSVLGPSLPRSNLNYCPP